jgi:hypothetical protein
MKILLFQIDSLAFRSSNPLRTVPSSVVRNIASTCLDIFPPPIVALL